MWTKNPKTNKRLQRKKLWMLKNYQEEKEQNLKRWKRSMAIKMRKTKRKSWNSLTLKKWMSILKRKRKEFKNRLRIINQKRRNLKNNKFKNLKNRKRKNPSNKSKKKKMTQRKKKNNKKERKVLIRWKCWVDSQALLLKGTHYFPHFLCVLPTQWWLLTNIKSSFNQDPSREVKQRRLRETFSFKFQRQVRLRPSWLKLWQIKKWWILCQLL